VLPIAPPLVRRLHDRARADRWQVSLDVFAAVLQTSAERAFRDDQPRSNEVERYLEALHLEDLALATACAAGRDDAWEHFIREYRPALYRAALAIDASGGARELADSLYSELFGLETRGGARQSLFRYYHGRSSLATWLRAILAQRQVDRVRVTRRLEPLPDEDSPSAFAAAGVLPDPDRARQLSVLHEALERALARLDARDRLRLSCYYAQDLTLAEIGRLMREHEATVSRHLARTRRAIRADVEHQLRSDARWSDEEIRTCLESAIQDAGPIDLGRLLTSESKKSE
jgi:RNA polymerase sigma-70 factor, ECF subfamily